MPDINFPTSPSLNDTYTYNDITYTWDGEKWTAYSTLIAGSANYSDNQVDIHLNQSNPTDGYVLSWTSGDYAWVAQSGGGGGSYADSDVDTHLNRSSASSGQVLTWNGSDYAWTAKTVDTDTDAQTLSLAGNVITISGSSSSVDLTTALGNVSGGGGTDSQTLTLNSTAGQLAISGGNNVDLRQTQFLYSATSDLPSASTYHGAIAHVHAEGALYFAHSGSWVKLANHGADIQPASISTDSTDGTALALEGGDASGLNSTGGNVDVNAGTGALQNGYVNIGQSSQGVYIGANSSTAINVTGPLTVNNQLIIEDGVSEKFSSLTGATGVVAHDCDNGQIFYHSSISANFTANFTNLGLSTNYSTNLTLILDQGATAYIPSAIQIGGSAQTINWQGGVAPTGTDNGIDAVSFTILRVSGNYVVLGQLVDFT